MKSRTTGIDPKNGVAWNTQNKRSSTSVTPNVARANNNPPDKPPFQTPLHSMEAHIRITSLNERAVTYDPDKANTLQVGPPHPQCSDFVGFLQQALRKTDRHR